MGSLGAAALIAYAAKGAELISAVSAQLKKISWVAIAAVVLPLIYLPVFISSLGSGNAAAQASAHLLTGSYVAVLVFRGLISLAGVGLLIYTLKRAGKKAIPLNLVYLALALVFVGEFIGRYVFYGSAVSIMIGLN
ncbi:DmsC/YnfH family molybdoenzyme membrane anchor subunit [Desulfitobacterium sp. Sab5]|uniref:DmsC/YnfH family molybdoenzyme membrane anchor subunit n=1 Tax=Desulfitobacterium nosdiversum TaxID=3375356 RepID=UPI003CFAF8B7